VESGGIEGKVVSKEPVEEVAVLSYTRRDQELRLSVLVECQTHFLSIDW